MGWLADHVQNCVPGISLDCVVFGYKEGQMHVLLLKYKGNNAWALPGGFLPKHEEMGHVISEILYARTGVPNVFLKQFQTFSALNRGWKDNEISRSGFKQVEASWTEEERPILKAWFDQRFISTAYFALIDCTDVKPKPDAVSDACEWIPIEQLPPLILDHEAMIDKAMSVLRTQINYLPLGRELLQEKFTMIDLQLLYEAILGQKFDRANFQRKISKLNMLVRHEKLMTGAQNKAPYLYSINPEAYDDLLENGRGFN